MLAEKAGRRPMEQTPTDHAKGPAQILGRCAGRRQTGKKSSILVGRVNYQEVASRALTGDDRLLIRDAASRETQAARLIVAAPANAASWATAPRRLCPELTRASWSSKLLRRALAGF
jgi:hypothetical protein